MLAFCPTPDWNRKEGKDLLSRISQNGKSCAQSEIPKKGGENLKAIRSQECEMYNVCGTCFLERVTLAFCPISGQESKKEMTCCYEFHGIQILYLKKTFSLPPLRFESRAISRKREVQCKG